jgi:hypothetical protein
MLYFGQKIDELQELGNAALAHFSLHARMKIRGLPTISPIRCHGSSAISGI